MRLKYHQTRMTNEPGQKIRAEELTRESGVMEMKKKSKYSLQMAKRENDAS